MSSPTIPLSVQPFQNSKTVAVRPSTNLPVSQNYPGRATVSYNSQIQPQVLIQQAENGPRNHTQSGFVSMVGPSTVPTRPWNTANNWHTNG